MKPINLKIQGINSYVTEQEIAFDKLTENNLFGIFGETGSGKTTILDAITIALYGSSDREIMPNIINVNSKSAHIYFVFDVDGKDGESHRYVVKREFKVRGSGVKADAILLDGKDNVLAEQPDLVNEKLLSIVGIGKKEFLKCIALPQGEFDRFLTDTPANRKKTIAKLFNLESFGVELQEKIKERKDELNLQRMNINDRINMLGDVSDEKLDNLTSDLNENQLELNDMADRIESAKADYETVRKAYENNVKLIDLNAKLGVLQAEETEIAYLKKQVEYTKKYGEYILLYNKQDVLEKQITELTDELIGDKQLVINNNQFKDDLESEISSKTNKLKLINSRLVLMSTSVQEYREMKVKQNNLTEIKEQLEGEISELTDLIADIKLSLTDYKKVCDEQEQTLVKLQSALDDNEEVLDRLKDIKTVKTIEDFIDYLNYAKSLINPDSMYEVRQFDIYKELNNMLDSMTDYETKSTKQIGQLQKDINMLSAYGDEIENVQKSLEKANREYSRAIDRTTRNINDAKSNILICNTKIEEKTLLVSDLKQQLKSIKTRLSIVTNKISTIGNLEDYDDVQKQANDIQEDLEKLKQRKDEMLNDYNNAVVSIEVGTLRLEDLKEQLKENKKLIKATGMANDNNDNLLDKNLYLDDNKLAETTIKVEEYDREKDIIISQIEDLKELLHDDYVTAEMMQDKVDAIKRLEKEQSDLVVKIALIKQLIDQTKEALLILQDLKVNKNEINHKMDIVNELSNLTANGRLLDYVSEEYMQLITQFSNKFVYKISKTKYLLKYDKEFYVIDNFNGGISRSVKTLSGGERFIISLSLALGISQSIAINNNKQFNFFFIDEGFGSLSDDYIEMVLSSFEQLVKLKFTVGFITHVDKMQSFINNRIVVTKKNNDEGSIVKQYS